MNNSSRADYGKFITPVSGIYQFLVTITNSNLAIHNNRAKIYLRINNVWKLNMEVFEKANSGTCHLVVKLNEGDKVWVMSVTYDPNSFMRWYTSFSVHLIHGENF